MRESFSLLPFLVLSVGIASVHSQSTHSAENSRASASHTRRAITGPVAPMNEAIARGATATITLQPVPPKTVPASNYPPASSIVGQTLTLGSVPARVWLEVRVTGWGPVLLRVAQVAIDAEDLDGDGGGYAGTAADCGGAPMVGAGDIAPARQACGGTCSTDGRECASSVECRLCVGGANRGIVCTNAADCPGGTCPPFVSVACNGGSDACRLNLSGYPMGSSCMAGIPSRCLRWDGVFPGDYFPPGLWCEHGFQDPCDPQWIGTGIAETVAVDMSSVNFRLGIATDVDEETPDFAPSLLGAFVLDVPADAKGAYSIDFDQNQTFLHETYSPDDPIPIAALYAAVIEVPCGSCCTNFSTTMDCTDALSQAECDALPTTDIRVYRPGMTCAEAQCCNCNTTADCQDNDVCTVDLCFDSCYCTNSPVPGWNPATECCNPTNGVQSSIPQSSSCRTGGCSLGGSSGTPISTPLPDGTACVHDDPCYGSGECVSGACMSTQYVGSDCLKVRFISFAPEIGPTMYAYRVRMVSLHHPDPLYTGGPVADFSAYEGLYRWVGPPSMYVESGANLTPVHAAFLGCDAHYEDWSAIDLLHVSGAEIIPSSVYEVQSIAQGLDINVESNYSAPITIATARWGDVVIPYNPPSTTTQPDAGDQAALVDKFRGWPGAMSKPRAKLVGVDAAGIPDMGSDVNFSDISATIDAFRGRPYPFAGPIPCP